MGLIDALDYRPRPANAVQRAFWHVTSSRPGAWFLARTVPPVDRLLLRLGRRRLSLAGLVGGLPVITLVTSGARSGLRRESPLVGVPVDGDLAVIGTNFGQAHAPSWWFNLLAHPDAVQVAYRGKSLPVRARIIDDEVERTAIWDTARQVYAGYDAYARRLTRPIHIAVLEPT